LLQRWWVAAVRLHEHCCGEGSCCAASPCSCSVVYPCSCFGGAAGARRCCVGAAAGCEAGTLMGGASCHCQSGEGSGIGGGIRSRRPCPCGAPLLK
jgi:hypothetical protein